MIIFTLHTEEKVWIEELIWLIILFPFQVISFPKSLFISTIIVALKIILFQKQTNISIWQFVTGDLYNPLVNILNLNFAFYAWYPWLNKQYESLRQTIAQKIFTQTRTDAAFGANEWVKILSLFWTPRGILLHYLYYDHFYSAYWGESLNRRIDLINHTFPLSSHFFSEVIVYFNNHCCVENYLISKAD